MPVELRETTLRNAFVSLGEIRKALGKREAGKLLQAFACLEAWLNANAILLRDVAEFLSSDGVSDRPCGQMWETQIKRLLDPTTGGTGKGKEG